MELRRIAMPLVAPFRTSFGTQLTKDAVLLRVVTSEGEGWGECVSMPEPLYASEYLEASIDVMRRFLIPTLFAVEDLDADAVLPSLAHFHGYRMAKGALEMAVLDAELQARGVSLGSALGATRERVACGVSVGIMESIPQLMDVLTRYIEEDRYPRIKLKIEPGWDVEPVRATRERFGEDLLLQVDANAAYSLQDAPRLAQLDPFGLLLIEQPLEEDDILGHAKLAEQIATPVCLDESITSVRGAITAIELGACSIVNIKAGRVGGYLEAKRMHDACVARKVPVWCGGHGRDRPRACRQRRALRAPRLHASRRHLGV